MHTYDKYDILRHFVPIWWPKKVCHVQETCLCVGWCTVKVVSGWWCTVLCHSPDSADLITTGAGAGLGWCWAGAGLGWYQWQKLSHSLPLQPLHKLHYRFSSPRLPSPAQPSPAQPSLAINCNCLCGCVQCVLGWAGGGNWIGNVICGVVGEGENGSTFVSDPSPGPAQHQPLW